MKSIAEALRSDSTVNKLNLAGVKIFSKKQIIRHIHTKMVISESTLLAMTANITDFDLAYSLFFTAGD